MPDNKSDSRIVNTIHQSQDGYVKHPGDLEADQQSASEEMQSELEPIVVDPDAPEFVEDVEPVSDEENFADLLEEYEPDAELDVISRDEFEDFQDRVVSALKHLGLDTRKFFS